MRACGQRAFWRFPVVVAALAITTATVKPPCRHVFVRVDFIGAGVVRVAPFVSVANRNGLVALVVYLSLMNVH